MKENMESMSVPTRSAALRVARNIGCEGAHQHDDGTWMPCATHDEMLETLEMQNEKGRKRRRPEKRRRVRVGERGIMGIDTLPGGGLVSTPISVKAERRKARADRLAATPAPEKERIFGSRANVPGSARSAGAASKIELSESTVESLKIKLRDHNAKVPEDRRTSLAALKAVYRRGAGAFSGSHRPGMSRGQWSMGRVNAFLTMLRTGKPKNSRYVNDNDLLPANHPWRKRAKELREEGFEVKRLGPELGAGRGARRFVSRAMRGPKKRKVPFKRNTRDANNNGMVQDGTIWERPAVRRVREAVSKVRNRKKKASSPTNFGEMLAKLKEPDGGFSVRLDKMADVTSGWAIARKGKALKIPLDSFVDGDGNVSEEGVQRLLAYILLRENELWAGPSDLPEGVTAVLGGWHEPWDPEEQTGRQIHLDVTWVFSNDVMDKEGAIAEGRSQNQISVTDLDAAREGDWENAFQSSGGNGKSDLEEDDDELLLYIRRIKKAYEERLAQRREST